MTSSKTAKGPFYKTIDFSDTLETTLTLEEIEDVKTEFVWFFNGENNARKLFQQLNTSFLEALYKKYIDEIEKLKEYYGLSDIINESEYVHGWFEDWKKLKTYNIDQFIQKIKTDKEFSEVWADMGVSDPLEFRNWGVQVQFDLNDNASVRRPGKDQLAHLIGSLATNPKGGTHTFTLYNPYNTEERITESNMLLSSFECTELSFDEKAKWFYKKHSEDSIDINFEDVVLKMKNENVEKISYGDSFLSLPKYRLNVLSVFNNFSSQKHIEKSEFFCTLLLSVISKIMNMVPGNITLVSVKNPKDKKKKPDKRYKFMFEHSQKNVLTLEYNQIKIKKD